MTADPGQLLCISEHIQVKHIPVKSTDIKFREKEVWDLVRKVMDGEKLIAVLGPHGVGKSSIARSVLHYVAERKLFTGGVIWV